MSTEGRSLNKKGVIDIKGVADKVLPLPETKLVANHLDSAKPLAKQRLRLGLVGVDMVDRWLVAQDGGHAGGVGEILESALVEVVRALAVSDVEHRHLLLLKLEVVKRDGRVYGGPFGQQDQVRLLGLIAWALFEERDLGGVSHAHFGGNGAWSGVGSGFRRDWSGRRGSDGN
jgi:hypothetical protein